MSAEKRSERKPSFETNLKKLEALVASLEEGDVPLEELVTKYEQGSKLLHACQGQLKNAQLRIEKLKEGSNNEFEPIKLKL